MDDDRVAILLENMNDSICAIAEGQLETIRKLDSPDEFTNLEKKLDNLVRSIRKGRQNEILSQKGSH